LFGGEPNKNLTSRFAFLSTDTTLSSRRQWVETTDRSGDPPLSKLGHQQARETGIFLDQLLSSDGITGDDLTWMSSPFLRTLQTSDNALNAMTKTNIKNVPILPEYSVFEWDGKGGKWHESLPPLSERVHYFPRMDVKYQSLFVPTLPEPRSEFHGRCERAIHALNQRYCFKPRSALVVVSHAAACIGLARAAANLTLTDITPAAPCTIFRLSRTDNSATWQMDQHDAVNSLNGHTSHLSDLGSTTVPWNHFGDKAIHRGYTGPPTSRFAPKDLNDEL
jgi:broad specificity phosphatase PhoE